MRVGGALRDLNIIRPSATPQAGTSTTSDDYLTGRHRGSSISSVSRFDARNAATVASPLETTTKQKAATIATPRVKLRSVLQHQPLSETLDRKTPRRVLLDSPHVLLDCPLFRMHTISRKWLRRRSAPIAQIEREVQEAARAAKEHPKQKATRATSDLQEVNRSVRRTIRQDSTTSTRLWTTSLRTQVPTPMLNWI